MHDPASAQTSDEELARRAQRGCAESFERLLRRFQVPVLHFLRHRVAVVSDAEDLAQETFLRAYENLHRYRPRWPFSAWLFTIARRASINHFRRARPAADSRGVDSLAAPAEEPLESMIAAEKRRRLWDAAADILTEEQTTAMWLYYVEDLTTRDIALTLGRSAASVKVMLFRARKRLSPVLRHFDDGCRRSDEVREQSPRRRVETAELEVADVNTP